MEVARRVIQVNQQFFLPEFQSLFLWKSLVEGLHGPDLRHVPGVSILVFMEVARRAAPAISPTLRPMFQSLFLWKSLVEVVRPVSSSCFRHVSILVFMEVARRVYPCARLSAPVVVSILVFMEVARRVQAGNLQPGELGGFNPCFYGSRS